MSHFQTPYFVKIKHVAVHAVAETDGSWKQMKEVIIVDPLEAKRLAAEEWNLLQARAALQVFLTMVHAG